MPHVFRRELVSHRRSVLFWSIGIFMLVASSMAKYATYKSSGQTMATVVASLPRSIQIIFGTNGFDLSKIADYYGVMYVYIALSLSLYAALLGADIIAKEEQSHTAEFLFTKPIDRRNILVQKLCAGVLLLLILYMVSVCSSTTFVAKYGGVPSDIWYVLRLHGGILMLMGIFYMLGAAVAGITKRPKVASGITSTLLLCTFMLSMLINFTTHFSLLRYISPFSYVDPHQMLSGGVISPVYIAISFAVMLVAMYGLFRGFKARDLQV